MISSPLFSATCGSAVFLNAVPWSYTWRSNNFARLRIHLSAQRYRTESAKSMRAEVPSLQYFGFNGHSTEMTLASGRDHGDPLPEDDTQSYSGWGAHANPVVKVLPVRGRYY